MRKIFTLDLFSLPTNVLIFGNKMSVFLRAKGLTETWIPYHQFEISVDFFLNWEDLLIYYEFKTQRRWFDKHRI